MFVLFLTGQNYSDNQGGEKKAVFILGKKCIVSQDIRPFCIFCPGLAFTLLPMAPPVLSVEFYPFTNLSSFWCDCDLCPCCSPCKGGMHVQSDFRWCLASWSINQPASFALTLKVKGTFRGFPKVNRA